jgi:hypothetical protein
MIQSDNAEVVARFQVTPEELNDAILALGQAIYGFQQGPLRFGKYHNWIVGALAFVVTSLIFMGLTVFAVMSKLVTADTIFLVTISMAWGAALLISWYSHFQKRRIRAALARQNFSNEVTVTDNGQFMSWDSSNYKYSFKYDQFDTLLSYKGGYYLVSGLSGLFIPGYAFANSDAKVRFESILREKVQPTVFAAFLQAEGR